MLSNLHQKDLIKSEAQFTFELKGDSGIEADTLSQILNNTVDIVNAVVQGDSDTYVNLRVTKFSTGSFDIDFLAVVEQVKTILNDPGAAATLLVSSVGGAFKIAKHLKGKKPKEIRSNEDGCEVVNAENESIVVPSKVGDTYFKDCNIENSVINIVNIVNDETDRPGFDLKYKKGESVESVEYTRQDFSNIKPVVSEMKEVDVEQIFSNVFEVNLRIRKPDLEGNTKWGFILDKNIDATIEDEEWLEKVRENNIKFGRGMILPVRLQMDVGIDKLGNVVKGSERYRVLKVTGEIISMEEVKDGQIGLF